MGWRYIYTLRTCSSFRLSEKMVSDLLWVVIILLCWHNHSCFGYEEYVVWKFVASSCKEVIDRCDRTRLRYVVILGAIRKIWEFIATFWIVLFSDDICIHTDKLGSVQIWTIIFKSSWYLLQETGRSWLSRTDRSNFCWTYALHVFLNLNGGVLCIFN